MGAKLSEIRADHVGRYEWAAQIVSGHVIDVACGCGYGAHILANAGHRVTAIDRNGDAIAFAKMHWARREIEYRGEDAFVFTAEPADWIICFETLEHIEQDGSFLARLTRFAQRLIVSVPNERVVPKRADNFKHHVRHYTADGLKNILRANGWAVESIWRQLDIDSRTPEKTERDGRTIIAICARQP